MLADFGNEFSVYRMSTFSGSAGNVHFAPRGPPFLSPFLTFPPGFGSAPVLGITSTFDPTLAMGGGILQNPGAPLQAVVFPRPAIAHSAPPKSSTAKKVLEGLQWPSKVIYKQYYTIN